MQSPEVNGMLQSEVDNVENGESADSTNTNTGDFEQQQLPLSTLIEYDQNSPRKNITAGSQPTPEEYTDYVPPSLRSACH